VAKYRSLTVLAALLAGTLAAGIAGAASASAAPGALPGIDVNSHNGPLNWAKVAKHVRFVYAKATEGTYYTNPDFTNQYNGPYRHGVIRGAYHFAIPGKSSGATQAVYFLKHGGGWSRDGRTLPGAVDLEPNPYGRECYGLSKRQMTSWTWDFVNAYHRYTGVYPVIYTSATWWKACTGNAQGFSAYDPLWIASYGRSSGSVTGYRTFTFWQYSKQGSLPGDQDVFNGTYARLRSLADG